MIEVNVIVVRMPLFKYFKVLGMILLCLIFRFGYDTGNSSLFNNLYIK